MEAFPGPVRNDYNQGKTTNLYEYPSLLDTAELAYDLSSQSWSELGSTHDNIISNKNPFGIDKIDTLTDNILALLLIRIIAILCSKHDCPRLPKFPDLSTTTISRTIIADEARRRADKRLMEEMNPLEWPQMINEDVIYQLRIYIRNTLSLYRGVFYHNCEHAHHVFLSANKLLDMMLCEHEWVSLDLENRSNGNGDGNEKLEDNSDNFSSDSEDQKQTDGLYIGDLQNLAMMEPVPKPKRPTYGIKKDPLIQFGFLFSALVHDVDHKGVSNRQLVLESDELAIMYNDQSVAEQRSLAVAFTLLMKQDFSDLRNVLFGGGGGGARQEFLRFRSDVIALVLCTDISSPERVQIVKSKWKEAFGDKKKHGNGNRRDSNDTNGNLTENEDRMHQKQMEKDAKAKHKKERNAWKSKPADPELAEPKATNTLVKEFFTTRGSMTMGNPTVPNVIDQTKSDDRSDLCGSFSENDLTDSSERSDSSAYSTCLESEGELTTYSRSSHQVSSRRQGCIRPNSAAPNGTRQARRRSQVQGQFRYGRRFTEPHMVFQSTKKKFHVRLGIRRALDLNGAMIEAYDKVEKKNQRVCDPDRPNSMKAIVVLEQMLKAADIAANMQKWETMLKWSDNLFHELKSCFMKGRGDDPTFGWHENQIAFFESYALPLANCVADTRVLEEKDARELIRNVKDNNVRWMIEGRNVVQKLAKDWDLKLRKRTSAPNIYNFNDF
jgi:hypothetical protein